MSNTGVANMGATFLRAVALFTLALSFSGYRVQGCCVGLHQGHADMVQAVWGVLRAGPDVAHVTHSLALTFSWPESAIPPGSWEGASGRVPRKEQMKA